MNNNNGYRPDDFLSNPFNDDFDKDKNSDNFSDKDEENIDQNKYFENN